MDDDFDRWKAEDDWEAEKMKRDLNYNIFECHEYLRIIICNDGCVGPEGEEPIKWKIEKLN